MRRVAKTDYKRPIARRIRVRMEFTAIPKPSYADDGSVGFQMDKKTTALRILAGERFGTEGQRLIEDWMLLIASDFWTEGDGDAA